MHRPPSRALSPHRTAVDLARFEGQTALGEPLELLFSAILRLGFGPARQGLMKISATWTTEEGDAYVRAMSRVEDSPSDDARTSGQRDCDRFIAVARHVLRAVEESSTRGDNPSS